MTVRGPGRRHSDPAMGVGGKIVWVRDDKPLVTRRLTMLTFRVEDADGQPARDLELYMGMPGHAIVMRRDLQSSRTSIRPALRPWPR